jgi:hypothetical protein
MKKIRDFDKDLDTSTFTFILLVTITGSLVAIMTLIALQEVAHSYYNTMYGFYMLPASLALSFPHFLPTPAVQNLIHDLELLMVNLLNVARK